MPQWVARTAAACALALLASGCTSSSSITPPRPTAIDQTTQAQLSQDALDAFARDLTQKTATGATTATRTALKAGHQMSVRDVTFQYVDSLALTASDITRFGSSVWAADVSTSYRLPFDPGPTEMTLAMVFKKTPRGAEIVSIGGHGDRSALWLDVPTTIAISPGLVVISTESTSVKDYVALGIYARKAVAKVLPHWKDTLVIEVPTNQAQLNDVLQTPPAQLADIAAVTTSADGTLTKGSPIHVFANPNVFDTMTTLGARVVMSHEATHVATQGPLSTIPTWMLEGFADFVALEYANIPVQTAAHQIIAQMAKRGVPTHLPTAEELAPTADGLGATYEEAWLVWRYLGLTYGEPKAVQFYEAVNGGTSLAKAFAEILGTTEAAFVQGWRADLQGLVAARPR